MKTLQAVKNFLNSIPREEAKKRPTTKTIQHKNGKQFILTGHSLYLFDEWIGELEELPITNEEESYDPELLVDSYRELEEIEEQDLWLLRNIKKYIKWFKTQKLNYEKNCIPVVWHETIFNAKVLEHTHNLMGDKNLRISIPKNNGTTKIKNKTITGEVLPLWKDAFTDTERSEIEELTNKFVREMK